MIFAPLVPILLLLPLIQQGLSYVLGEPARSPRRGPEAR